MKVDIIIAGAEKCGTTALHYFLSKHPKVIGSNPKELHFFNVDPSYNKGFEHYHSFFNRKPKFGKLRGYHYMEASPSYIADTNIALLESTAGRIHKYNPYAKIIILVRDPAKRAFSAWKMYKERFEKGDTDWAIKAWIEKGNKLPENFNRRTEEEFSDFELYVKNEIEAKKSGRSIELNVLRNGHYEVGIGIFKKQFGENLFVLKNEDLNRNTGEVLEKLAADLSLSKFDWKSFAGVKIFTGKYSDKPTDAAVALLKDYYREADQQLKLLTGISYS